MSDDGAVVVVGGTRAIGRELVRHYVQQGRQVVLTGQSAENVAAAVAEHGEAVRGVTFDLAEPHTIAAALADVGPVDRLALVAIDRDQNRVDDYDIDRAIRLVTLKLVGYTTVVSTLGSGCRRPRRSCCSAAWPRSARIRGRPRSPPSTAGSSG